MPLAQLLAHNRGSLPPHLSSLDAFVAEVYRVVSGIPIAATDIYNQCVITAEPEGTQVMLAALGYLKGAPFLQCVVMHLATTAMRAGGGGSSSLLPSAKAMSLLYTDTTNTMAKWDAQCRSLLLRPPLVRDDPPREDDNTRLRGMCQLRRDVPRRTALAVRAYRVDGPRPSLLIAPSGIAVAGLGVYLLGSAPEGSHLAVYAGMTVGASEARHTQYTLEHGKIKIDASVVRCVAGMFNDPKDPSHTHMANAQFRKCIHGPTIVATRAINDEELFVDYGREFTNEVMQSVSWVARSRDSLYAVIRTTGNQLPEGYS